LFPIGQDTRGGEDEGNKSQEFHELMGDEKINNQEGVKQSTICQDQGSTKPKSKEGLGQVRHTSLKLINSEYFALRIMF
jgi:hypothetical protein